VDKDVLDAALFFRSALTIVYALALTEAFKQAVNDKATAADHPVIWWRRLPALFSFLLLIFPFYQGMSRYFYNTYSDVANFPKPYSLFLSLGAIAFTGEAALFFVMSRALEPVHSSTFYWSVLVLLAIDSLWGWITLSHSNIPGVWILLNGGFAITLLLLLQMPHTRLREILSVIAIFIRTAADYYFTWTIYFPPLPSP
jgi:hypothetical protein